MAYALSSNSYSGASLYTTVYSCAGRNPEKHKHRHPVGALREAPAPSRNPVGAYGIRPVRHSGESRNPGEHIILNLSLREVRRRRTTKQSRGERARNHAICLGPTTLVIPSPPYRLFLRRQESSEPPFPVGARRAVPA